MRFMAEQLRRGGAPSEIVHRYATADASRGRNDACTCGSGRKWKHCHGAGEAGQIPASRPS
jgi:serine-type anaerobic sulfatase-maturating enzyme